MCRSMRENLVFVGIEESHSRQNPENCEQILRKFLETHVQNDQTINMNSVQISNVSLVKVNCIGGPPGGPQPIVAKFEKPSEHEKAKIYWTWIKGRNYINEQFIVVVELKRRALFPIKKSYKRQGQKCTLIRDKLYVNDFLYDLDSNTWIDTKRRSSESNNGTRYIARDYVQPPPRREPPSHSFRPQPENAPHLNFETPDSPLPRRNDRINNKTSTRHRHWKI